MPLFATAQGGSVLEFRISRPYSVLNFLDACVGVNGTSGTLKAYAERATSNDTAFKQLLAAYKNLELENYFTRSGFPEKRPSYGSTKELLIIAAVQSHNLAGFRSRSMGILHHADLEQLIMLMQKADAYYQRIIWEKHGGDMLKQLQRLQKMQSSTDRVFRDLCRFYGTDWPVATKFTVALTAVPGVKGETAATPHTSSLCVDVLTKEKDLEARVAIALHEVGHVLFASQSRALQHRLESYFDREGSIFSGSARSYLDEGLATAVGNGWAYKQLTGKQDTADWYNDPYINGFGKALYPLVSQYIARGKGIDSLFIREAMKIFAAKFPEAEQDYGILFNSITIICGEEEQAAREKIREDLFSHFNVRWLNTVTPVIGPESLDLLRKGSGTRLVIVDKDHDRVMDTLRRHLPGLDTIRYEGTRQFVIHYKDALGNLILIACIRKGEAGELFRILAEKGRYSKETTVWTY